MWYVGLVPQSGIECTPPLVEAQNLNHWTFREVPSVLFIILFVSSSRVLFKNGID